MLHSSPFLRKLLASAGVILLLLSSGADAFGWHRCAHHDGAPPAAQGQGAHHGHGDGDEQQGAEGCTCVGACALSGAALLPAAADVDVTTASARTQQRVTPAEQVRETWQPHLLPYSTAPPASL